MDVCRDTYGYFNASTFQIWTCTLCYHYLFREKYTLKPNWNTKSPRLVPYSIFNGSYQSRVAYEADIYNSNSVQEICNTLEDTDCARWKACCNSAISCCQRQRNLLRTSTLPGVCPSTWDGFGCFNETEADTSASILCPDYIQHGYSSGFATKKCTENGTWWTDPFTNKEWTNYASCMNMNAHKMVVYVGIVCCSLSLFLLIPACAIFLSLRQLRKQNRIKLHLCLFISFIVYSAMSLVWDLTIYTDTLDNPAEQSIIYRNTIFCRFLYFMRRYARTCNYFWMFCEGFYLHRLMVQAFKVPRSLKWYYIFGWGASFIPIGVYVSLKSAINDSGCWVKQIGPYEWIVYTPNLLSTVGNFIFLCNILRILLTQVQTHPNEPNNYRRALKASFILVPLFGLQLFLVIYRPQTQSFKRLTYEILTKIIIDSQGAVIALMLCFLNEEVHGFIKPRLSDCFSNFRRRNSTRLHYNGSYTMYSTVLANKPQKGCSNGKREYIGMHHIKDTNIYQTAKREK